MTTWTHAPWAACTLRDEHHCVLEWGTTESLSHTGVGIFQTPVVGKDWQVTLALAAQLVDGEVPERESIIRKVQAISGWCENCDADGFADWIMSERRARTREWTHAIRHVLATHCAPMTSDRDSAPEIWSQSLEITPDFQSTDGPQARLWKSANERATTQELAVALSTAMLIQVPEKRDPTCRKCVTAVRLLTEHARAAQEQALPANLASLRDVARRASPGPWSAHGDLVIDTEGRRIAQAPPGHGGIVGPGGINDQTFIATFHPGVVQSLCELAAPSQRAFTRFAESLDWQISRLEESLSDELGDTPKSQYSFALGICQWLKSQIPSPKQ